MKFSSISMPLAASALALLLPLSAYGAGLGRLTVNSALGQPFSGEIPILASKTEMENLTAALAGDDVFKQAGVEYLPSLTSLHFSIATQADGKAVLKITSDKPINDPFLDILVQLNWASGKLVREYTVLLDPPGMGHMQIATPMEISPPAAKPLAAPAVAPAPAPAATPAATAAPQAQPLTHKAAAAGPSPKAVRVRSGDTLSAIAQHVQPKGTTLDQTLVGLFEANRQAFVGNNMNRLKVGSRLTVPTKEALAKTSPADATKQVQVQVADWNAYRQRLAGAVAKAPAAPAKAAAKPGQSVTGQATVKVAPATAPSQTPVDVLKLSKGTGATTSAIAKEQALRDAQSRTAALKQQIQEMKQLAQLKEKALQQRPAAGAPPAPAASATPAAAPVAPKAPSPAAKAPAVPAPVVTTSAPVPSSQSWYSVVQDNPLYWAGGAAILLLGGTLWWMMGGSRRRKGKDGGGKAFDDSVMTGGELKTNTLIAGGASGGTINTGDTSFLTDFSQAGLGNIDTHDVDPIAEAEVYMAYGRDAQAEEILKEAIVKTPERQEIRLKLLEIYAARKNLASFESVASDLYAAVEGQGPLWDKAAEMGRLIDPANPLYGGGGVAPAVKAEQPEVAAPAGAALAAAAGAGVAAAIAHEEHHEESVPAVQAHAVSEEPAPAAHEASAEPAVAAPAASDVLSFEGLGELTAAADSTAPEAGTQFQDTASGLNFDLGDLDFGTEIADAKGNGASADELPGFGESGAAGLDFSGLDLNLDTSADELGDLDEVSTKLDLARAYLEMGDKEGAREILQEVIAEGNQEQKSNAQSLIAGM